jgi:hypothetical protein
MLKYIFLLVCILLCESSIYRFHTQRVENGFFALRTGVFSYLDAPIFSTTEPYISFNLNIASKLTVQMAFVHSKHIPILSQDALCKNGKLQIPDPENTILVEVAPGSHLVYRHPVTRSGLYYLFITNCASSLVILDGSITVMNPYGYLPAQYYGRLPFYFFIGIFYILASLLIFIMFARGTQMYKIHYFMIFLYIVSMFEMFSLYISDFEFNQWGQPLPLLESIASMLTICRSNVFKLVLLLIAHGYSLNLEAIPISVITFSILYFFALFMESILRLVTDFNIYHQVFFVILEIFVFVWILYESVVSWRRLSSKKQTKKVGLIQTFLIAYVLYSFVNVIWFCYEKIQLSYLPTTRWETLWTLSSFYYAIYFCFISLLILLWRPSDSFHFEYSVQPDLVEFDQTTNSEEEEEAETDPMIKNL